MITRLYGDSRRAVHYPSCHAAFEWTVANDAGPVQTFRRAPPTTGYLNLSLGITSLAWYTPPTRFDAVMHGAGSAVTLGMFLGAIGNTLGWFDETTTWWLAGSLAAAGGIYAGSHYRPEPRIQIRLSTPGRPADGGQ